MTAPSAPLIPVVKLIKDVCYSPQHPSGVDANRMNISDLSTDIETIAALGGYEDEDAVVSDTVRELLRQRPRLPLFVAVE